MKLNDNELIIMRTLWSAPRPLTRREIVDTIEARGELRCRSRTMYLLLNELIEKEMIYVPGYIYNGERGIRVFAPVLSQVEYTAKIIEYLLPAEKYDELFHLLGASCTD